MTIIMLSMSGHGHEQGVFYIEELQKEVTPVVEIAVDAAALFLFGLFSFFGIDIVQSGKEDHGGGH